MTATYNRFYRTKRCNYATGSRLPQTKLSESQVREIRRRKGEKQMALAAEFGCSPSNVALIHNGKIWKHIL